MKRAMIFPRSLLITAAAICLFLFAASIPAQAQFVLTKQQAADLFKVLRGDKLIPFDYKDEGCFARAHQMFRDITNQGYLSFKIWNYGSAYPNGNSLKVEYQDDAKNKKTVTWTFHVAPVVVVDVGGGKLQYMVLDPAIFDAPVTVAVWRKKQDDLDKWKNVRSKFEITLPIYYLHDYQSEFFKNKFDFFFEETEDDLRHFRNLLRLKEKQEGIAAPTELLSSQTGIVTDFNPGTGTLRLTGSMNLYMLDPTDPRYSIWATMATESEAEQESIYVAYDPGTLKIHSIFPTAIVTVAHVGSGSGTGTVPVTFVYRQAGYSLSEANPGYSQFLTLLQQSEQNQTPLQVTADFREVILDVQPVPAR